jgi:hypothetical protein
MTGDRVLYFGFIVLFLSVCLLVFALIATQPVTIYLEADVNGKFGDINTIGNVETPNANIPKFMVSNPLTGDEIELYNGTVISIPGFKIKSSFEGFNASIHVSSKIEAPVYVLVLAYMNRDKINITNGGT